MSIVVVLLLCMGALQILQCFSSVTAFMILVSFPGHRNVKKEKMVINGNLLILKHILTFIVDSQWKGEQSER